MGTPNVNQFAIEAWVRSGQAAETAQELAWFVALVFIIVGLLAWRGDK